MPFVAASFRPYKENKAPPFSPSVANWIRHRDFPIDWNKYRYVECVPSGSYSSVSNYARPQPTYDKSIFSLAKEWMHRMFYPKMCGSAIADQEVIIEHTEKKKSPGFYWNKFFDDKGDFFAWSQSSKVLSDYWNILANSDPLDSICQVSDKVEGRPAEKLDQDPPSFRTFICDGVERVIAGNRLCLDMNEKFYRTNLQTPSVVGRSKYGAGFHHMMEILLRFFLGFSIDFSKYDMSLFYDLLMAIAMFRFNCLRTIYQTDANKLRMLNYYETMIKGFLWLTRGDFVFKTTGNNSGQNSTIVDNTLANYFILCYAFIDSFCKRFGRENYDGEYQDLMNRWETMGVGDPDRFHVQERIFQLRDKVPSYAYFNQVVAPLLAGDDNTCGVDERVLSWFNVDTIALSLASLGMKITSTYSEPVPVQRLDFLSHNFVTLPQYPNIYLPSPDTTKVLCSLLKFGKSIDVRWSLLRAFALRLESWANLDCRNYIKDYIEFAMRTYERELVGYVVVPGIKGDAIQITWDSCMQSYFTDEECEKLYYGFESASRLKFLSAFKLFEFCNIVDAVTNFLFTRNLNINFFSRSFHQ